MVIYEIAVYLVPFITAPYIARVLGTYGTGVYSYTYSIVSYFVVLTQLGVNLYGRREIASCLTKEQRSKTFWCIWYIETIMFIVSMLFYVCFVVLNKSDMKIAFCIQIFTIIGAWLDISWMYFGVEDFKIAVSRNVLVKILSLLAVFTFVRNSDDTNLYVFIMAFSNFASVIVMWITIKKHIFFVKITRRDMSPHVVPMFKMFIPVLSTQLFSMTDKVFLGTMSSVDSVGIYENAYKISRVPVAFITTIGTVMLPRMTKLIAEGKEEESKGYFEKSLSLTVAIGVGCSFGLIGIANVFIPLYLGTAFKESAVILQLLALVLIAIAWGNAFRTQFILPKKMDNLYLKSVLYAAVINIVLNAILIPGWSAIGAAIASIIAEFLICIYQSIKIRKFFRFKELLSQNSIYLIAGLLMDIELYFLNQFIGVRPFILLCLDVLIGAISYMLLCCLFELMKNNFVILNEILRIYKGIRKTR